jgi:Tfp pilus assembly protein PilN
MEHAEQKTVAAQGQDSLYALADYKQMVLTYQARITQARRDSLYWKTALLWLGIFCFGLTALAAGVLISTKRDIEENKHNLSMLTRRAQALDAQLQNREQELAQTQQELLKRQHIIVELEKSISTNSKKLLERILQEQEIMPVTRSSEKAP